MKYLYDNNMGGCLADDMGLGKTLQTIGVLNLIYPRQEKPTLLVMPRSLLFNWQNEITRFSPKLKVYTYYGNTREMVEAVKHQLILTTYAIVRNDIETFKEQNFHYVILDESQNIKNVAAQSTQAVYLLKADHRLALSGTPIENNLTELYLLFRFLNPTMFGTLDDFNARYANPIRFQNNRQCKVLLMTLKTGGVGLNLTAADTVYIFEPWWNKAAEEQTINRLHRFGQKANVLCYSLITQGTIEEKIQLLQQQKADLFKGLIGADASSTKQLSEEDIQFILG